MSDEPKDENTPQLPEGVSPVRYIMADVTGIEYRRCSTLDEAKQVADAALVMEGDYGGQIYLTCPIRYIRCGERELVQLFEDIDALGWHDLHGAGMFYEILAIGSGVAGGMGGGVVTDGLWLHPWFDAPNLPPTLTRQQLVGEIWAVIDGQRDRITHDTHAA
jgi:hypothetical protein